MISFLDSFSFWHWFIIACSLFMLEFLGAAGYLFWLGMSALFIAVFQLFFDASWLLQWSSFASISLLALVIWWYFQHKSDRQDDQQRTLNQKRNQFLNQPLVLNQNVTIGKNRIKINDGTWLAYSEQPIKAGTMIEVIDIEGITLIIKEKNPS